MQPHLSIKLFLAGGGKISIFGATVVIVAKTQRQVGGFAHDESVVATVATTEPRWRENFLKLTSLSLQSRFVLHTVIDGRRRRGLTPVFSTSESKVHVATESNNIDILAWSNTNNEITLLRDATRGVRIFYS